MMRPIIAILAISTFIGCAKHTIDTEVLCRRWVMDDSDISSFAEFHSDGRVSVVYELCHGGHLGPIAWPEDMGLDRDSVYAVMLSEQRPSGYVGTLSRPGTC